MIVYFGSNGQLLEVIEEYTIQNSSGDAIASSFITNAGNINSNKIFALFEGETPLASQCAITYKMPNGEIFSNASFFGNALVDGSIKFDKSRDLKYLSYGKTYEFVQFNLPSALLSTGGAGVYQTNITLYPSSEEVKDYSQFSFKALGTPASLVVNEITDTQYSIIMAKIANIEADVDNFVPYSGATDNVNLGTHRLEANDIRASSSGHTIDLAIGLDAKPHLSYDTGQKIFFLPIDGATGTLATQGWVNDQNFVPFEENGDVDIGEYRLTAGQVSIEEGHVSALFNLQQNGTLEIVNHDDNGYEFIFEFPIDGEEEDTYHIATREWVNAQDFVPYTGATKDLNLGGHNLIFKIDDHGTNREWNIKINTGNEIVFKNVTNNELFVLTSSTTNATQHIATQRWVEGLLTPSAVGTGTLTKANVNGYNGAQFTIGDNNGLYFFTYGNCSVMIPVYGLVAGTEYKIASALNGGGQAGYQVKVLTYRLTSGGDLQIYQKENFIPTGYTAYLMRIKLY